MFEQLIQIYLYIEFHLCDNINFIMTFILDKFALHINYPILFHIYFLITNYINKLWKINLHHFNYK